MTWALIPVQRYQHSIVVQVPLLRRIQCMYVFEFEARAPSLGRFLLWT